MPRAMVVMSRSRSLSRSIRIWRLRHPWRRKWSKASKACDEPPSPFFSHVLFPAGYDESRGSRGLCRIGAGSRLKKKKKRGRKGGAARDWLRGLFSRLASVACSTVYLSDLGTVSGYCGCLLCSWRCCGRICWSMMVSLPAGGAHRGRNKTEQRRICWSPAGRFVVVRRMALLLGCCCCCLLLAASRSDSSLGRHSVIFQLAAGSAFISPPYLIASPVPPRLSPLPERQR